MTAKKFIIPFVLASLAGHALVLALTTRIHWTARSRGADTMTVEFKAPPKDDVRLKPSGRAEPLPVTGSVGDGFREDSVALQEENSRYSGYLLLIRQKIERLWDYPRQALLERKEGNTVIHFTIDEDGALSGYRVMTTSGSPILDRDALAVVRSAAPYAPLPADFNLSRLHITAIFSYRMNP